MILVSISSGADMGQDESTGMAKRGLLSLVVLAYLVYLIGFLLQYGLNRLLGSPPVVGIAVPTAVLIVATIGLNRYVP